MNASIPAVIYAFRAVLVLFVVKAHIGIFFYFDLYSWRLTWRSGLYSAHDWRHTCLHGKQDWWVFYSSLGLKDSLPQQIVLAIQVNGNYVLIRSRKQAVLLSHPLIYFRYYPRYAKSKTNDILAWTYVSRLNSCIPIIFSHGGRNFLFLKCDFFHDFYSSFWFNL